jgi:poly(A) polymerase/tRNA nucleotidyltransferase (CCA-adding enzyme)
MAALLHDVGKPRTKAGEGPHCTFYAHDTVGARMARDIMKRLKFPNEITDQVIRLVRYHMFYYNVGEVTESSVRRLLAKVGPEHIDDLLHLREGDRIGSGTPKAVPYKLRHLKYMIDKVSHDPISAKMLKVNGQDVMEALKILPGPKIGLILNTLLAEVLDDPALNERPLLLQRARELDKSSSADLQKALDRIEQAQEAQERERMKKYYV